MIRIPFLLHDRIVRHPSTLHRRQRIWVERTVQLLPHIVHLHSFLLRTQDQLVEEGGVQLVRECVRVKPCLHNLNECVNTQITQESSSNLIGLSLLQNVILYLLCWKMYLLLLPLHVFLEDLVFLSYLVVLLLHNLPLCVPFLDFSLYESLFVSPH
jgi:hypothetical protein